LARPGYDGILMKQTSRRGRRSTPSESDPAAVVERLREGGRKGGLKGGKARWKGTTAEERSAIARKAARARWGKTKKAKRKLT
jgi:hypothetical protein